MEADIPYILYAARLARSNPTGRDFTLLPPSDLLLGSPLAEPSGTRRRGSKLHPYRSAPRAQSRAEKGGVSGRCPEQLHDRKLNVSIHKDISSPSQPMFDKILEQVT